MVSSLAPIKNTIITRLWLKKFATILSLGLFMYFFNMLNVIDKLQAIAFAIKIIKAFTIKYRPYPSKYIFGLTLGIFSNPD